eukprot:jgi/Mesen1/5143/ME000255S04118
MEQDVIQSRAESPSEHRLPRGRHRVLMVSDFFYPNFGGVESHIYHLAQCLLERNQKVVVVTHAHGGRAGVRHMARGLKVYYAPRVPFYLHTTLPTLWGTLPLLRCIMVREAITLVHGHQAFSTLAHEATLHARALGLPVVFTDHSLYGFSDAASIHMNKVLKFTLADVQHAICVSHTSKENTVLRSGMPPHHVSVIPNAVDASMFTPDPARRPTDGTVTIVVMSRLVYRKGADLLADIIPEVCRLHPQVRFVVGGDGARRARLEEMRDRHGLHARVAMLGSVPHARVRSVLVQGHIFLNTSLTEAFCIAILEAACCGLLTVSTRVGGVPEVLPSHMIVLADVAVAPMVAAIGQAIERVPLVDPLKMHDAVAKMYSWRDVAVRTEKAYDRIQRMRGVGRQALLRGGAPQPPAPLPPLLLPGPASHIDIAPNLIVPPGPCKRNED